MNLLRPHLVGLSPAPASLTHLLFIHFLQELFFSLSYLFLSQSHLEQVKLKKLASPAPTGSVREGDKREKKKARQRS